MKTLVLLAVLVSSVICQEVGKPWTQPWKKTTDFRGAYKGMSRFPGGVKWELKLGTTTVVPQYDITTKSPAQEVVVSQYRPQRVGPPVRPPALAVLPAALPALPTSRPALPPPPPTLPPLPSRGYLPVEDTPSRHYLPVF